MVSRTGQMGVPVTVLDGQTVIGFDRPRLESILAARAAGSGASGARSGSAPAPFGAAVKPVAGGLLVGSVRAGAPADRSGLRAGDVITAVDGRTVADTAGLVAALSTAHAGAPLAVLRDGHETVLRLT
jgi:S1-C subfamily serine protease